MMQNISLLNSIIGPVMRGPSSSHSAGPFQIADTVRQLAAGPGERSDSITIKFNPAGSFAAVYTNQGSDEGFAAGFLDLPITDEAYSDALRRFESGEVYSSAFEITPLVPNDHPNRVHIEVVVLQADGHLRTDLFRAVSLGGGMFTIDGLNEHSVDVDGAEWVVLVEGDAAAVSEAIAGKGITWSAADDTSQGVTQYSFVVQPPARELEAVAGLAEVERVRVSRPAQLCVVSTIPLLDSSSALIESDGIELATKALEVESIRLGLSTEEVRTHFEGRCRLMLASVARGLKSDSTSDRMKFLKPSAQRVRDAVLPSSMSGGFLQDAMSAALAVMEQNTNRGVVVAAPTAGSAGIVPGVLHALSRAGVPEATLVDSLQVMALIGGVFAVRGSFAAETGGCAVETGASAAMAAGGLAHAMGGDATQIFRAASLCLMNTLGLVCDPVAGEVEIPCHARNIAGVAHAHAAAIATLSGFDAVMPFDDMVQATVDVGKMMHADLRCTGRGGCAAFCPSPKAATANGSTTFVQLTRRNPDVA
jgi:L-serine dehydratase